MHKITPAPLLAFFITAIGSMVVFSPATLAAPPICQLAESDSDGDGWGWENFNSCVTNSAVATPPTVAPLRNSRFPSCSDTSFDSDGDGWGWENNASCAVDANTPTQPNPPVDNGPTGPTTGGNNRHPACTTTAADSDGDGWGYENGVSCLVTVNTQSGPTTPPAPTPTPAPSSSRYPVCSSAAFDVDNDGWGYENFKSCIVVPDTGAANGPPTTPPAGNNPIDNVGVIFNQTFATTPVGLYQGDQLNSDWQSPLWHLGFDQGRVQIVTDADPQRQTVMEVTYPAGAYGASGASAFLSEIQFGMNLPRSYNELYVAYDVKFDNNFEFVLGGKLPGLCGYDINQAPNTGCNTGGGFPSGYDGWSARGMWRVNGALENYVYHANQANFYGDDEHWNVSATPGIWHRIQHRVVLNTVGQQNGILEAWLDGTKVLSSNTLEYRKTDTIGINLFYFSTFFGGNDVSWAPSTDQRIFYDNFTISTNPIP